MAFFPGVPAIGSAEGGQMEYRKASKFAGLALVLVIAALPRNAGASDAEARALARTVLDSTTLEWSQTFSARESAYRAPKVLFTRLPRPHPARGAGYSPGELVTVDLGELEEIRAIFPRDGAALAALIIAHEVAHHVQFLETREGRYTRPADPAYELQADCAAGWWLGRANARQSVAQGAPLFAPPNLDLQLPRLFQALYTLKHRRLSSPSPAAVRRHGSNAQRIAAFEQGLAAVEASSCWSSAKI